MDRLIVAHVPASPEELLFKSLSGEEHLSRVYAFEVELLCPANNLDLKALLGQPLTVEIRSNPLTPRYLSGFITRMTLAGREPHGDRYYIYRATINPALWYLEQNRDFRIWQEKTVPDIVSTLLNDYQIPFENRLTGSYRQWGYCVQYNESDLDFISRLMEHEGIYYYFRHEQGEQTLVLADAPDAHKALPGYEAIPYNQPEGEMRVKAEGIQGWSVTGAITPGLYSHDDYDFRKPRARLFEARQNPGPQAAKQTEVYDWPGRFTDHQHGQFYVRVRQQELAAQHQQMGGKATSTGLAPGFVFNFIRAPRREDEGEYLTVGASYLFTENHYASGGDQQGEHRTTFTVVPAELNWRPERGTAWPRTYGPQTAEVVGPQGEPIWTDKYGRVKVKFRWDRYASGDDTSSCWVRVSSAWAGWKYGGVQVPRVGEEVVVDFINGDPDRPIITGRVYNEDSLPPWDLPNDATKMGFMSRSKNGTKDNASFLFFEDRLGSESFDMHAERDMNISVENNKKVTVDGTHTEVVQKATSYHHKDTRETTVDQHDTQTFNNGRTLSVTAGGRKESITDGEEKSVTGCSDNSYTDNVTVVTDKTISTKAADRIMFDAANQIVYGQTIDAKGVASEVNHAPFNKDAKAQLISAPGTQHVPNDYMKAASGASIAGATKVVYKKGVVTDINGVDQLTVDENQIVDIKGNVSRNINGTWFENVDGDITINAKSITFNAKTSITSNAKSVNDNGDIELVKWTPYSGEIKGFSAGLTMLESNYTAMNFNRAEFEMGTANGRAKFTNAVNVVVDGIKSNFAKLTTFF
ncbi:type VI secretion system tip protein VgrG [Paramixta manurensis]|uniref:Type VI secretion system tip protein VgrG n=1 Tax=Paramixta manurensis TaxID=2740817 RepID=A0A6M8UAA1_9GAMM|nr:type VI secretion system tip protein VgrG [Erwiniaceae bacterium PD-1]